MVRKFSKLIRKSRRNKEQFSFTSSVLVSSRVKKLINDCSLAYINPTRVFCVESTGSKSRAYARVWGLSRIWQETLGTKPAYILEVTHRFNKLNKPEQDRVLLHELAHIPKNFSGALIGHNGLEKRVQEMVKVLKGD